MFLLKPVMFDRTECNVLKGWMKGNILNTTVNEEPFEKYFEFIESVSCVWPHMVIDNRGTWEIFESKNPFKVFKH